MALYEALFDGPIDIIGDIHGEIDALRLLLSQLGYDELGEHQDGRRLVFLGDIVDRGPDSPAVVETVMSLVRAGRAQCILGNHELNILLGRPMFDNGWMVQPNSRDVISEQFSIAAKADRIPIYKAFFSALPIILENKQLRVVHACWNSTAVDTIKSYRDEPVIDVYSRFEANYTATINQPDFQCSFEAEKQRYESLIRDPEAVIPMLPNTAKKEYLEQMMNPIRTITTSSMVAAEKPFFAGGKWRMAERDSWWETYLEDIPVVIGHFWRQFDNSQKRISGLFGRDVFAGAQSHAWMGAKQNVFCVDYSVGQRFLERQQSTDNNFKGKLAALRMPERQVIHDDGVSVDTV